MRMILPSLVFFSVATLAAGCSDPLHDANSDRRERLCALMNEARATEHLPPLELTEALDRAAQPYAEDMAARGFFSHVSPEGSTFMDRIRASGAKFRAAGENIAMGPQTSEDVFRLWMNSPGHRANILSRDFRRVGVGYRAGYWVQSFTD